MLNCERPAWCVWQLICQLFALLLHFHAGCLLYNGYPIRADDGALTQAASFRIPLREFAAGANQQQ